MIPCMRQVLDPAVSSVDNEGFFARFLFGLKRMQNNCALSQHGESLRRSQPFYFQTDKKAFGGIKPSKA